MSKADAIKKKIESILRMTKYNPPLVGMALTVTLEAEGESVDGVLIDFLATQPKILQALTTGDPADYSSKFRAFMRRGLFRGKGKIYKQVRKYLGRSKDKISYAILSGKDIDQYVTTDAAKVKFFGGNAHMIDIDKIKEKIGKSKLAGYNFADPLEVFTKSAALFIPFDQPEGSMLAENKNISDELLRKIIKSKIIKGEL
tara:strand:- start:894 stop:1493 length:600 start_codon:yes stop_codon:yes gene_type:complete